MTGNFGFVPIKREDAKELELLLEDVEVFIFFSLAGIVVVDGAALLSIERPANFKSQAERLRRIGLLFIVCKLLVDVAVAALFIKLPLCNFKSHAERLLRIGLLFVCRLVDDVVFFNCG